MKKLLLAAVALAALAAGPAVAADLGRKAPAYIPPPAPPPPSFTGCYVDGGVGYGLWNIDHSGEISGTNFTTEATSGGRGWLGRVGGGCDYQFSPAGGWATGSSARSPDYDLMNLHGGFTDAATLVTAPSRENWAAAAGGRIGVLVTSQVLTYVNGGWTSTRFSGVDFPRGADHLANTDF